MTLPDEPPGWFEVPDSVLEEHGLRDWYATLRDWCPFDPSPLIGVPLGMFHCPVCGCMVLAGVKHPSCDPLECGLAPDATLS